MSYPSNIHTPLEAARAASGKPCWSELVADGRDFGDAVAFVEKGCAR